MTLKGQIWFFGQGANRVSLSNMHARLSSHLPSPRLRISDSHTNINTFSGSRLIKREQLHVRKRRTCDKALLFAIIGISRFFRLTKIRSFLVLMITENELCSANLIQSGSHWSLFLKAMILGSTAVLLLFAGYFHVIEVQVCSSFTYLM